MQSSALNATCSLCQAEFPTDDLIQLDGNWLCGSCKPQYVQMLREGAVSLPGSVTRLKKTVVAPLDTPLPHRCIYCNKPGDHHLKRTVYWYPSWVLLLFLLNFLIMLIAALIVRRKTAIEFSICDYHKKRRTINGAIALSSIIGGVVCMFLSIQYELGWLIALSVVMLLAGFVIAVRKLTYLTPTKLTPKYVQLRGAGRQFLDSLPEAIVTKL